MLSVGQIADRLQGEVIGNRDLLIGDIRGIEEAGQGDLTFLSNPKYARYVASTGSSAVIVGRDYEMKREDLTYIVVDDSYSAFIAALRLLRPLQTEHSAGIASTASMSQNVELGEHITIGPNVVVESGCVIGDRTVILANSVLGRDVHIGHDSVIYPNVTIYAKSVIGSHVSIHSGTVIGADGFGFTKSQDGEWEKIPQTGSVVVEDDVEIGASVTIDRGTLGETLIGQGSKLDNLIHVAHNVRVGSNTVIAAQTGISGSTTIGPGNMIAGQVGIVGHIETTENVIIEAQSGVSKSLLKPGRYFGHPAKEHSLALRQEGALRQLPNLLPELRELRRRLRAIEEEMGFLKEESE